MRGAVRAAGAASAGEDARAKTVEAAPALAATASFVSFDGWGHNPRPRSVDTIAGAAGAAFVVMGCSFATSGTDGG